MDEGLKDKTVDNTAAGGAEENVFGGADNPVRIASGDVRTLPPLLSLWLLLSLLLSSAQWYHQLPEDIFL